MTPTPETETLSGWLRFTLGKKGTWKSLTGNASWFYDKLEEAIPKAKALEAQLSASERARQRAVQLLDAAWWSRDLHGCRFCFAASGQFSTANMVRHATDCPYAVLAGEKVCSLHGVGNCIMEPPPEEE